MDTKKVSDQIYSLFESKWCQEHIVSSSILLKKRVLTRKEILDLKQDFETYFVQYRTFDNNSEEKVKKLQEVIKELNQLANALDETDKDESESEQKKSLIVCSSSLFKKDEDKSERCNWSATNIVGLDFSYTKSYQISPDIRRGNNESQRSALSLIYKWKGLKSSVSALSIPINEKELSEYLLGAIVMFSIFDPIERGFPLNPKDPSSCKELLNKVENWTVLGEKILSSFGLTKENIGNLIKKHLSDIAFSSQEVEQDMEGLKSIKKKNEQEYMADIWSKRKKAYLKNIEKTEWMQQGGDQTGSSNST